MRGPYFIGGAAWEPWLPLLHRHQLPQGHGMGTCFVGTDPAQHPSSHEDLLCSAWALPLSVTHQGTSPPEGAFLLSVRGCESQTHGTPTAKTSRQKLEVCVCMRVCVCTYVHVGVHLCAWVCLCDSLPISVGLPLAWGPPGESLEL